MSSAAPRDLTPITVRLAALWVAAGALFKLFAGTPNDLPPVLHELPIAIDLFFKLAVGLELAIVSLAFLRPRLAWIPLVALFAVFDGVLTLTLNAGEASCGCFGSSITIPPALMLGIDSVLLLAILFSKPWNSSAKGCCPAFCVPVALLACLILPFPYVGSQTLEVSEGNEEGSTASFEDFRYVMLAVEDWKGQLIYDTDFAKLFPAEIESLPTDGLYVLWRWDCDHCAQHLAKLSQEDDMSRPIVLVRLTQDSDDEGNRAVFNKPSGGHVTELALPAGPQYIVETPADFFLEGGLVISAREGIKLDEP